MLVSARTVTCSHWFWMALSAQVMVTRSEPPAPPPPGAETLLGAGAAVHPAPLPT